MEEQKKKIKKGWKTFWVIFDIIFFGIYFLYFLVHIDPWGTIHYYDGLNGTHYSFGIGMLPFFYWHFTVLVFVILVARLYFWNRLFKSQKVLWIARVVVILCNPIFAWTLPTHPPGYKPFLKGYQVWAKSNLPMKLIRNWMGTLDETVFEKGQWFSFFDNKEDEEARKLDCPKAIINVFLYAHSGYLFKNEADQNCLKLYNGGGFAQWGVVIGPKEMEVPPSDFSDYGEYRIKLEEGVYVWHELQ